MARLTCACGQEYEIRDDTPKWAAPWFACGDCFLADGIAGKGSTIAARSAHKLANANRSVSDAQRDLNRAYKDAKRNLEDLYDQMRDAT